LQKLLAQSLVWLKDREERLAAQVLIRGVW
jgi:hypothetical protein